MNITRNIHSVLNDLGNDATLVAVSKTQSIEKIKEAYLSGQKIFGENRVEELVQKEEKLPKDIEWHMIGHLQSKKVKKIARFISLIHSVDSLKILEEINKRAAHHNRVIKCLIQVHIAQESSKSGFREDEVINLLNQSSNLKNVKIVGLMGMATFTNNTSIINKEFNKIHNVFKNLRNMNSNISILSIGMSSDYKIAIKNGSTMVRIGSTIFGNRK